MYTQAVSSTYTKIAQGPGAQWWSNGQVVIACHDPFTTGNCLQLHAIALYCTVDLYRGFHDRIT